MHRANLQYGKKERAQQIIVMLSVLGYLWEGLALQSNLYPRSLPFNFVS